jgi:hypothetical protein
MFSGVIEREETMYDIHTSSALYGSGLGRPGTREGIIHVQQIMLPLRLKE